MFYSFLVELMIGNKFDTEKSFDILEGDVNLLKSICIYH